MVLITSARRPGCSVPSYSGLGTADIKRQDQDMGDVECLAQPLVRRPTDLDPTRAKARTKGTGGCLHPWYEIILVGLDLVAIGAMMGLQQRAWRLEVSGERMVCWKGLVARG